MTSGLLVLAAGLLFVLGLLSLRAGYTRALHANAAVLSLGFPAGLEVERVTRFLASLSGLLPPWWTRWLAQPAITFETLGGPDGISHRLVVPRSQLQVIENGLQAHLPSVRYQLTASRLLSGPLAAAEYRTTTQDRPLRVDAIAAASELLSNVQPLASGEQVVVQWTFSPAAAVRPPRVVSREDHIQLTTDVRLLDTAEHVAAVKAKQRAPLLLAVGRIAVRAGRPERRWQLLGQAEGPLHGTRAPGVQLCRRWLPAAVVASRLTRRSVPLTQWPASLNIEEASALVGWPIGQTQVPGLELGGCRLLPVAKAVPEDGTVIGKSTYPGARGRTVGLDLQARLRHLHVSGPTGVGKSTLLARIVEQDLSSGHGVVVLDPKGDLISTLAARIPEGRLRDVIVLDAADEADQPVGYNPLLSSEGNRELVVEQVSGVMRSIWRASWGPRVDDLLRGCLTTLASVGGMTLAEVVPLLTDEAFRRHILSQVTEPGIISFWQAFAAWKDPGPVIQPLLNKMRAITTLRPRLRAVFGQADPAVNFDRIIQSRGVLLVNLAAGRLGTEAAYLLGALLFAGLWDAVSARASRPEAERPPVMAVLDEFQHLVALPTPAETVLAEARGYGLGLVLAHQHLGQLDHDLERAVLANARSRVVMQTSRADAATLARELGGGLTPEDLMGISAFEAVSSVFAAGAVQPPATISLSPLDRPLREPEEIFALSRQRWGAARADVESAMAQRQGARLPADRGVIGRKGRTP